MRTHPATTGRQRRRIERLYRKIVAKGAIWVRRGCDRFRWGPTGRDVERLHEMGRIDVEVSKVHWYGRAAGTAKEIRVQAKVASR